MRINVTYSTSDKYSRYASVSMTSLFENNKDIEEICVYYIEDKISKENKNKLINIAKRYNRVIEFIAFQDLYDGFNFTTEGMSRTTYGKLFLANRLNIDKILHIDSDTLIVGSLKNLWELDIEKYYVAGVLDCINDYNREINGMKKEDKYINGGIVLFNLKLWKTLNLVEKAITYIKEHPKGVVNVDQGVINAICKENILVIDPCFNVTPQMFSFNSNQIKRLYQLIEYYPDEVRRNATKNPIIIHFITHVYDRPWNKKSIHPLKDLYYTYWCLAGQGEELESTELKFSIWLRQFIFRFLPYCFYETFEKMQYNRRKEFILSKMK